MDKPPPHSKLHEEALLSCMFVDPLEFGERVLSVFGTANPMYIPRNKLVYDAFLAVDIDKIDPLTISDYIEHNGQAAACGGIFGLREIISSAPSTANFDTYLQWVKRLYQQRTIQAELYNAATELNDPKLAGKLGGIVDKLEVGVNQTLAGCGGTTILTMEEAAKTAYDQLYDSQERMKFGLPALDKVIGGLPYGSMCTLAARPGCGKSTLLVQLMLAQAMVGEPVYMASLEMPYTQVLLRMVANLTQMNTNQLLDPVNAEKAKRGYDLLAGLPIYIDDKPSLTISQFCRTCKRMRLEHGVKFVGLDYLQRADLEGRRGEQREQTVARGATLFKNTMIENEQVGMLLAQLNRGASEGAPAVHHLRESGAIEQESDQVILLHGEKLNQRELDEVNSGKPQVIKAIIGKNRHGGQGVADVLWTKPYFMFEAPVIGDEYVPR